jgi:hypothetical protein
MWKTEVMEVLRQRVPVEGIRIKLARRGIVCVAALHSAGTASAHDFSCD